MDLGTSLQFAPRRIAMCFPELRKLELVGPAFNVLEPTDPYMLPSYIEELEICCGSDNSIPLRYVSDDSLATIQVLAVEWPDFDFVDRTMRHLDGDLHLMMKLDEAGSDQYIVDILDASGKFARHFVQHIYDKRNHGMPAFFAGASWHARVTEVTISQTLWAAPRIARHFPALPGVKKLNFIMDLDAEVEKCLTCPAGKIDCSGLSTLAVIVPPTLQCGEVYADEIEIILDFGLASVPRHLCVDVADRLPVDGAVDGWTFKAVERIAAIDEWF
ncbi:hypothetical protein EXIGLDRAFT_733342 [Exidia glandulosa HHB12029]|uniref:Uncharacterized protein n=1 Tax=Exidia glandulosa HHB12029 TaxID=1314781 RepID=A0A165KJE8_EXIGL|nr:hypothetical protein EXIGLDRAFT_733342 [Exidia glandulosa HHB12029]